MLRSTGKQSGESEKSARKKKRKATVGRICGKGRFKPGVMDDESGESMVQMKKVPLRKLGELEFEILVRG